MREMIKTQMLRYREGERGSLGAFAVEKQSWREIGALLPLASTCPFKRLPPSACFFATWLIEEFPWVPSFAPFFSCKSRNLEEFFLLFFW